MLADIGQPLGAMVMMHYNGLIQKISLSPEFQLLLDCGKQALAGNANNEHQLCIHGDIDWVVFSQLADYHRLQPVVADAFSKMGQAVPDEVRNQMQHDLRRNAVRNLLLTSELIDLTARFDERGIPVLPYKGPMLAAVTGNRLPRQFNDLDILLHEQDLSKATALLQERGYHSRHELSWEHSFYRDDSQLDVDLHWAFTGPQFYFPLNFKEAWAERREVILSGRPLPTLGKEHTVLVQCINASKDYWPFPFLDHILDLARLLIVEDPDWDRLFREARQLRCERIFLLGIYLANTLFAAPIPDAVGKRIKKHWTVSGLGAEIICQLNVRNQVVKSRVAKECFRARIREDIRDQWPYYMNMKSFLVTVNEKDYALLRLPRRLSFLYYVLRPFRLLRKHLLS